MAKTNQINRPRFNHQKETRQKKQAFKARAGTSRKQRSQRRMGLAENPQQRKSLLSDPKANIQTSNKKKRQMKKSVDRVSSRCAMSLSVESCRCNVFFHALDDPAFDHVWRICSGSVHGGYVNVHRKAKCVVAASILIGKYALFDQVCPRYHQWLQKAWRLWPLLVQVGEPPLEHPLPRYFACGVIDKMTISLCNHCGDVFI
jgi:hypothetical protein